MLTFACAATLLAITGCKNQPRSGPDSASNSLLSSVSSVSAGPLSASALQERVKQSLVVVRYVFDAEAGRREFEGVGTVVAVDGTTMVSLGLFPVQMPDSQITQVKIVIPPRVTGTDELEIPAELLTRDERTDVAFVRPIAVSPTTSPSTAPTTAPVKHTFTPIAQASTRQLDVGQTVFGVGLMSKSSGYTAYLTQAQVSAHLRGPVPQVLVSGRLPVVGSPVFDGLGNWVGFVQTQEEQIPVLNHPRNELQPIILPPFMFIPAADFAVSLIELPTSAGRRAVPYIGIGQMDGLSKEVAQAYGLASTAAIQVGDVPAGFPAADAGLLPGDIIVSVNSKPLERGDLPEELPMIMLRKLLREKPGDVVTLGVVRAPNTPPINIDIKLGERPMIASQAARYFAEDLAFSTRDLVWDDKYRAKLDPSFAGVAVQFVRQQGAAQTGGLRPGDFVTKLNQTAITSVDQFKEAYLALRESNPKDAVVMEVQRGVDTQIIRIEPPRE
jgi:S1-C subfamily serine protease